MVGLERQKLEEEKDRNWNRRKEKRVVGLGVSGLQRENGGCAEKFFVREVVGQDGMWVGIEDMATERKREKKK